MLATAITLSLFAFVLTMVVDVIRRDGQKILAALEGRSLVSEPMPTRPVTVRFSPQRRVVEPRNLRPLLRVAA
jgi:hypothetical protein